MHALLNALCRAYRHAKQFDAITQLLGCADHAAAYCNDLEHAQVAELGPGDAVFIPSMWWHYIQALEDFNVLVNYWWRRASAWMDSPMNALMLAIMTVRDLPPEQREIWEDVFRHYVFGADEIRNGHIPENARGVLGTFDDDKARALRARLLQRITR